MKTSNLVLFAVAVAAFLQSSAWGQVVVYSPVLPPPAPVVTAYMPTPVLAPAPVITSYAPAPVVANYEPLPLIAPAAPVVTAYAPVPAPVPVVTAYAPAPIPVVTAYAPAPVVAYSPVIPAAPVVAYSPVITGYAPYAAPVGYGTVVVRPKVYVVGQPVRNFFRAITP